MNLKSTQGNFSEGISIIVSKKEPSASDKMDGQIKIELKGGQPPYTLTVHSNTRTNSLVYKGDNFDLKDLPRGFYVLNITDSEGNFTTQNINL
jgi:hypothetical protein